MSLVGRFWYQCYHRPLGVVRDTLRAGGPLEQRRTERGRQAMEDAARSLPPLPPNPGSPLEPHLLTGQRYWYQTAFCLWTLARTAARPIAPVLYDDGTLGQERDALRRLFPQARLISRDEAVAVLDAQLPLTRYPFLRDRWRNYPHIRKLIDPHLGSRAWRLVLDSDLLFFRRPDALLHWLEQPAGALHATDCASSYGYSRPLMDQLAGQPVADRVNVGVLGLNGAECDWDRVEYWCRSLMTSEGPQYYLEQALAAMLVAGRSCTILPPADYVTGPFPPEALGCAAVMHHYVDDSKRWYFQHNWRRVLSSCR